MIHDKIMLTGTKKYLYTVQIFEMKRSYHAVNTFQRKKSSDATVSQRRGTASIYE